MSGFSGLHFPSGAAERERFRRLWPEGSCACPTRSLGTMRAVALHDHIVARRLEKLAGQIDIIHTWPLGALETLKTAARLGNPDGFGKMQRAYRLCHGSCARRNASAWELCCRRIMSTPTMRRSCAKRKKSTDWLPPPVSFGFRGEDISRSEDILGSSWLGTVRISTKRCSTPAANHGDPKRGLTMLFVGVCAVRKGVHYALEAWLKSPASKDGTFLIAGEFLPAYQEKLASMLAHPSVKVLGHRNDVPELMRKSDILVLPSIEEGSAL